MPLLFRESNADDLMNQNQPLFDISGIDDDTDDLNTQSKNDDLMNIVNIL